MKTKSEKIKAFIALHQSCQGALTQKEAYEELFILECARFLLSEMKERQTGTGGDWIFDEFFIECQIARRFAPQIALEICRLAKEEGGSFGWLSSPLAPFPKDLCFVKNRFTEEVLPLLEEETGVYYAESFEDACLMTAEGRRAGCLLPYMGADRQPLPGIARLIDEYDLKKCRSYLIDNGTQNAVYLLLSGTLCENREADLLEFTASGSAEELEKLPRLARKQQLLCSLPSPIKGVFAPAKGNETLSCRFTVRGDGEDLLLFADAVRLCLDDSTVTGLYNAVELIEE